MTRSTRKDELIDVTESIALEYAGMYTNLRSTSGHTYHEYVHTSTLTLATLDATLAISVLEIPALTPDRRDP